MERATSTGHHRVSSCDEQVSRSSVLRSAGPLTQGRRRTKLAVLLRQGAFSRV